MSTAPVVKLFTTISEIDAASSSARVLEIFRAFLETYGLDSFLITGLPVPHDIGWHRAILCDGWPSEWFVRYESEGHFLHDPCAARSRVVAEPFLWHQLP